MTKSPSSPRPTVNLAVNPDAGSNQDLKASDDFDQEIFDKAQAAHALHDGEGVECTITIKQPADQIFSFIRNFANLPLFMRNLDSVEVLSPVQSHWKMQALGGIHLEWDAEIIAEIENRMVSWKTSSQTSPNSGFLQAGSVWLRPVNGGSATEIHVQLRYRMPGGPILQKFGPKIAAFFGDEPSQILNDDLEKLRDLLEAPGDQSQVADELH